MIEDDLIYDVGMHKGEDTEFYLKKGFRVIAVEAMPSFCAEVKDRLSADVTAQRLTIVSGAIAERPGTIPFYVNPNSVWGTTQQSWSERNERLGLKSSGVIEVPALDFADLLRKHGVPHYLKVDIEGADLLCLEALKGGDLRPRHISIESNKVSWPELL